MPQKTASEAFTGVFNEGLDRFLQTLIGAYQAEYQMKQQAAAQELEQQRYEQQRQDALEREQRQEMREQANFVQNLITSQQEMLAQQQANVEDPAMRARLGSQIESLSGVLTAGVAGPEALLEAYQQQQQTQAQQPFGTTVQEPRQPDWVPTGTRSVVPEQVVANVKPPVGPTALAGQAAGVAQDEERERQRRQEEQERRERERQAQKQFYQQLYITNYDKLISGNMSPEYRQALAQQFEGVDPSLLPPGASRVLQNLGAAVDERAQTLEQLRVETAQLERRDAENRIESFEWKDPAERQQFILDTGIGVNTLDEQGQQDLIALLNNAGETVDGEPITTAAQLRKWAGKKQGQVQQRTRNEVRQQELAIENSTLEIRLGNQTYDRRANLMETEEWQQQRMKVTAAYEDEEMEMRRERFGWETTDREVEQGQFFIDNIANSVSQGTPEVIQLYLQHFDDPRSPTGRRLRQALGADGKQLLENKLSQAQEMQDLKIETVRTDAAARDVAYRESLLALEQKQELMPYQTEALRATYELDAARATNDLNNLALDSAADRALALGQMAQVVPPETWDNLTPDAVAVMERLGLSPESFKAISETHAEMRGQPLRQEAFRQFEFLMQSDPRSEADKAAAITTARQYLSDMEVPEELHNGMLAVLQAGWADNADSRWLQHEQLTLSKAIQAAKTGKDGGIDIDDLNTLDNSMNRLVDNQASALAQQRDALQVNDCVRFYEASGLIYVSPVNENADKDIGDGQTCSMAMSNYTQSYREFDELVGRSSQVTQAIANAAGLDVEVDRPRVPGGSEPGSAAEIIDLSPQEQGLVEEARQLVSQGGDFTEEQRARAEEINAALLSSGLDQATIDNIIRGQ